MRYINLDMDGVVADFNSYCGKLLGREIGWEAADLTTNDWNFLASVNRLYYNLEPTPYSQVLVNSALSLEGFNVRFLTAIPRVKSIPSAEKDKRDWLNKYFPGIPMCIGPHSKDKHKWAYPGDILIDDKISNTIEWFKAGGIAIRHSGDIEETLKCLSEAVKIKIEPKIFGNLT